YSATANTVSVATNGAQRLYIDNLGNVGIGTGAPVDTLHVVQSSGGSPAAVWGGDAMLVQNDATVSTSAFINLIGGASVNEEMSFGSRSAYKGGIGYDNGFDYLYFHTGGAVTNKF